MQDSLTALLALSAARHDHLCPRQVLGVRMGLAGLRLLDLSPSDPRKQLIVIAETDGCFADGLEVATGASVGHRTLRIADLGKIAATFTDVHRECSIRLVPNPDVRSRAGEYTPNDNSQYFAQLTGYQRMPDDELFLIHRVALNTSIKAIVSHPGVRATCSVCREEIINEREVLRDGQVLCRTCAGEGYYIPIFDPMP